MTVYFDKDTNKYYCNFRYRNYLGELKGTTKRGFKTYDEAKKWELNFKENNHGLSSLSFKEFTKVYLEDSR